MRCSSSILLWLFILCIAPCARATTWCEAPRIDTIQSNAAPSSIPDFGMLPSSLVANLDTRLVMSVELAVTIEHPFPQDLKLYLSSPQGTRLLVSTGRGGHDESFYRDRLLSDLAAPVDLDRAILPNTSLAGFMYQQASGAWKLEVVDGDAGEQGVLVNWSLIVHSCEAMAPRRLAQSVAITPGTRITDRAEAHSAILMPHIPGDLCGLSVDLDIKHSFSRDLDIRLVAPNGLSTLLASRQDLADGVVRFAHDGILPVGELRGALSLPSPTLSPQQPFTQLFGQGIGAGPWELRISDSVDGDTGLLNSWSLNLWGCGEEAQPVGETPASTDPARPDSINEDHHLGLGPLCLQFESPMQIALSSSSNKLSSLSRRLVRTLRKVDQVPQELRPVVRRIKQALRVDRAEQLRAAWLALKSLCAA